MDLFEGLKRLLGGSRETQDQARAQEIAHDRKGMAMKGGLAGAARGAMQGIPKQPNAMLPQQPQKKQMTLSQRDFPGRTNYGVKEDNMIDTPNGYITAQQYDQLTPADRDFPGRTNYGVPQDNMIDTPNGYITPQQYNQQQTRQNFAGQQPNFADLLKRLKIGW